jgi:hypothetical protein
MAAKKKVKEKVVYVEPDLDAISEEERAVCEVGDLDDSEIDRLPGVSVQLQDLRGSSLLAGEVEGEIEEMFSEGSDYWGVD